MESPVFSFAHDMVWSVGLLPQESQIANTANGVSGTLVNPVVASKLATGTCCM